MVFFKLCCGGRDGDWKKWASFGDTLILKVYWKYLLKPILRAHCIWSTLKRNERDKIAEFTSPFQLHHLVVFNKYEGASLSWNWPTLAFSVLVLDFDDDHFFQAMWWSFFLFRSPLLTMVLLFPDNHHWRFFLQIDHWLQWFLNGFLKFRYDGKRWFWMFKYRKRRMNAIIPFCNKYA